MLINLGEIWHLFTIGIPSKKATYHSIFSVFFDNTSVVWHVISYVKAQVQKSESEFKSKSSPLLACTSVSNFFPQWLEYGWVLCNIVEMFEWKNLFLRCFVFVPVNKHYSTLLLAIGIVSFLDFFEFSQTDLQMWKPQTNSLNMPELREWVLHETLLRNRLTTLYNCRSFYLGTGGVQWYLTVLIYSSLVTNDAEYLCICHLPLYKLKKLGQHIYSN